MVRPHGGWLNYPGQRWWLLSQLGPWRVYEKILFGQVWKESVVSGLKAFTVLDTLRQGRVEIQLPYVNMVATEVWFFQSPNVSYKYCAKP